MILKLFIFWRLGLFLITYLGTRVFEPASNGGLGAPTSIKGFDYWFSWAQWDGGHYFALAQRGYQQFSDYAFFPLYPTIVKIADAIHPLDLLSSGLLIANSAFLLFLIVFHKYLEEKYSKETSFNAIISFLVFPTAFYAGAYYSESVFLLLAVTAFLFISQKNLLLASIAVCLASLTRQIGIFLAISVFYNYFSQISFRIKNISTKVLAPTISTLGFSAYLVYLYYIHNDPLKFLNVQSLWLRSPNDPVSTIVGNIWMVFTAARPFDFYMDLAATVLFLSVLVLGTKKISSSLWIFSTLAVLIPASSGTLTSMSRYVLASLGTFIIIGEFLKDHPMLKLPLWGASLFLQVILASRFISGYWVA